MAKVSLLDIKGVRPFLWHSSCAAICKYPCSRTTDLINDPQIKLVPSISLSDIILYLLLGVSCEDGVQEFSIKSAQYIPLYDKDQEQSV